MGLVGAYAEGGGGVTVYAGGMGAVAAGSAVTATAGLWSFAGLPWLVAGRVLQGLGGGGLVPLTLALAADLYRNGARTLALGSVAGLPEAGSVFGPLYGATLAALVGAARGSRLGFRLNVPLAPIFSAR